MSDTVRNNSPFLAWKSSVGGKALRLIPCAVILLGTLAAQSVGAEEHLSDEWQFAVRPYFWFVEASGDATVKGREVDVDLEFSDIWDSLNIAFMAEADARKGRWGVFVHPILGQLEWNEPRVDFELDVAILGFGGTYRLGPWALSSNAGDSKPRLVVDIYAGGRYTYLNMDLNGSIPLPDPLPPANLNLRQEVDWLDPIIGIRTAWHLSPKWFLTVAGDIGGFGVGADFAWMAMGLLKYNLNLGGENNASLIFGYRAMGWDYSQGNGNNKFEWNVTPHGPVLGFGYRF